MKASKKTKRGVVGAVALASILAVGGYALTNTISFEEASTLAGRGEQVVQVLQVTDTDYALDALDPTMVESISFTIDNAVVTGANDAVAWVRYNTADGWIECDTVTDGDLVVTCTFAADVDIEVIGQDPDGADAGTEPDPYDIQLVLAE